MPRRLPLLDYPPLSELRRIVGAEPAPGGAERVTAVCADSRRVSPGSLFVALRGERFDGHGFVQQALHQGATAAVVERWYRGAERDEAKLLRVRSPLAAYHALSRWRRQALGRPVVAVTGSVGKTTTKELVRAALASKGPLLVTPGNYNNEFGVPDTLGRIEPRHRIVVVEMGMRGRGEIRELGEIALPDVGIITNVGTAHIGRLGSRRAIAEAKCELLETLAPNGVAVLNADDDLLMETARRVYDGDVVTFGLARGDYRGQIDAAGMLQVRGQLIEPPLPGPHHALNLLAAIAVARRFDVPWEALQRLRVELPTGRARRIELRGGITLMDETYNAGLESTLASLHLLAVAPATRRIAVLGTMKELGDHSVPLHRQVGRAVADLGLDQLCVLADDAEAAALLEGAAGVPARRFDGSGQLTDHLSAGLRQGDVVLLKASRAVALDQVVAALLAARGVA
ncbi:MAG: UDP-N-acetylmuramoyl-tripeptide--D-alanyl-D-alanine ligase [Deltaproteobacteria bacterium]|jgi:UDP-N-acetylmuramoyl-tripeptide--D-alanyl-D-alanine ligase|nr:UDP-N-acetylmuramoyl-tripeptide--D-alanyl-D-alanine ligase [Deltaproteobacteria bacterium]MBW2534139.1 UDP-N-acetylmuramoyl-tripeptide--D-alanyl-D-alanine ligase [Deltaproteobacteria bacterium]